MTWSQRSRTPVRSSISTDDRTSLRDGKGEEEGRADVERAIDPDPPSVGPYETRGDGQPEARPGGRRALALPVALEDVGPFALGDADALVGHRELDVGTAF